MRSIKSVDFMRDIVSALDSGWGSTHGAKPRISVATDRRIRGLGQSRNEEVLVFSEAANVQSFGIGGEDWRHSMGATIAVNTNVSEERLAQMMSAVYAIMAANVRHEGYSYWKVNAYRNLSQRGRNYWSGVLDAEAVATNPETA